MQRSFIFVAHVSEFRGLGYQALTLVRHYQRDHQQGLSNSGYKTKVIFAVTYYVMRIAL